MNKNRAENMLLLQACTTFDNPGRKAQISQLLETDIEWRYLLQTAERHGVIPQLYWNLKGEKLFDDVMEDLRDRFRRNTITSLVLTQEMLRVFELLTSHDIPAIPYKGPTLAVLGYGDVTLRRYCDLDFLIHKRNVIKAKELLLSRGYQPEQVLSPEQERSYLENECEYNFYSDKNRILVELHWDVVQNYFSCPLDIEDLWNDLKPVSVLGRRITTFSPECLLLILCAHHGAKHQWGYLGSLCDLAQLVANNRDLDWEWVLRTSDRWGLGRMLRLGLRLVRDLLSVDLPCVINAKIENDQIVKKLTAMVEASLFDHIERMDELRCSFFYLKAREKMGDKFRYVSRRLFTPTRKDWAFFDLPASLYHFYRFMRPFRLFKEFATRKGVASFFRKLAPPTWDRSPRNSETLIDD